MELRCDNRDHVSGQRGQPSRRGAGISSVLPARVLVDFVEAIQTCHRPDFLSPKFLEIKHEQAMKTKMNCSKRRSNHIIAEKIDAK